MSRRTLLDWAVIVAIVVGLHLLGHAPGIAGAALIGLGIGVVSR